MFIVTIINPEVMDQAQNDGDTVSFTCQATGVPFPAISWYFNGASVNMSNTMKYTTSEVTLNTTTINNTLTITSVESSDVGTYTCNATNVVSSDTSSGVLTVNGKCTNNNYIISKFSILCSCVMYMITLILAHHVYMFFQ